MPAIGSNDDPIARALREEFGAYISDRRIERFKERLMRYQREYLERELGPLPDERSAKANGHKEE